MKVPPLPPNVAFNRLARQRYPLEAICWILGIFLLALTDPTRPHVFSLCLFSWVFDHGCPGCGLGRAIAFLVRGAWAASWQAHPLAAPALLLLSRRVFILFRQYLFLQSYSQKPTAHG